MDAAELERRALEELRSGNLDGARGTLTALLQLRPQDQRLRDRIAQIDRHIAKRNDVQAQIRAEPLKYARAYLQAGRLAEALQLLREVLAKDPDNLTVRDLALDVARRLKESEAPSSRSAPAGESQALQAEAQAAAEAARKEAEAKAVPPQPDPSPRGLSSDAPGQDCPRARRRRRLQRLLVRVQQRRRSA